jgi:hypothetical protein
MAKADKADFAEHRRTNAFRGERRTGVLLAHKNSWPAAAAPFDAYPATYTKEFGDELSLRLSRLAAFYISCLDPWTNLGLAMVHASPARADRVG